MRYARIRAALLLTFVLAAPVAAQTRSAVIVGRVVSADGGAPLASATLDLRAAGDTVVLARADTDATGRFRFDALAAGRYVVSAAGPGRVTLSRGAAVAAGDTLDLGTFELAADVIELDPVRVETEAATALFAPDRDIYDAAALPGSAGGVATELLAAIPELEVDLDGAVSLRGGSPTIYINGRPAPMDGESLNIFLQQFPADAIERIEVIPNPSARYDADGSGIVNIVLKEGASLGLNGSIFANAHTRGEAGLGGRAAWQKGDVTLFGNAFLRRTDRESESYDLRQNLITDPTTYLRQEELSERGGISGSADLTVDWQLAAQTSLRAEGSFSDFGSEASGSTTTTHLDEAEQWTQRYDRIATTASTRLSGDAALRFSHGFDDRGHELEIELELESGRDGSDRRVETEFEVLSADGTPVPADLTLEDRDELDHQISLDADYARPWGERGSIELGYRGRLERREDDRLLRQFDDAALDVPAETTRRGFDRRETVHALYLTLDRSIGDLGVQVGGRVEHADNHFEDPQGTSFHADWFDFFPSANLTYTIADGKRLRFSYSRRTRRPSPRSLNPIDRSTDPLNRRVGNPDLEPQYTHSLGLDASTSTAWGNLRISPYWRRVANDWADIRTVDEDGIATTMPMNVASQDIYGASLTVSLRRGGGGWGGFVSLSGHGESRDASNLSERWNGSSFRWSVRANVSGRLSSTLSLRTSASYSPPRDGPQGRISSRFDSSLGLRQQLLDRRASLSLTVRDPLELSGTSFESRDPTFIQIGRSEISRRSASVSFSWSFGGGDRGGRGRR